MTTTKPMTAEQFGELQEDGRFDLIAGEVYRLSPSKSWHSAVSGRLSGELYVYARAHGGASPTAEGGYLVAHNPDSVLCPDASYIGAEKKLLADNHKDEWYPFAPDIAVEVLSPSESRRSIARKVYLYLAAGSAQVWIVDTKHETLTVHALGAEPRILTATDTLNGGRTLPGFTLERAQLFR
jgi:Uma2 family endonuclease